MLLALDHDGRPVPTLLRGGLKYFPISLEKHFWRWSFLPTLTKCTETESDFRPPPLSLFKVSGEGRDPHQAQKA